jgi:vacuole morphology and inheritance protein 14
VSAILDELVNDFAYAVHQPHARNGGLIGLAAAAIALGSVSIPPVHTTSPVFESCHYDLTPTSSTYMTCLVPV